ncbi:peroxisome assembly protein 26 isoform X2 [Bufo gargarizans]|uniref:peroxisome assembly protein 26 isoform X2 n=1 Tax=Bufo gargarizans TaxID=30331 RepID=UPI001CF1D428|nr:peroxisome assembly protein 26 isoform X2 [Bufo gargarizans]
MAVTENVSSCSLSAMWDWSHLSLSGTPPAFSLLDAATDLLVLERNFAGALELCERGLQIITTEPRDTKNDQVKAALVVIAIQALAEMERWREVLPWLLQYYRPQEMPHNIMEMCLLLYSRVKQPHVMLELSRDWLREAEELAQDPQVFSKQQQEVVLTAVREEKRRLEREEEEAKVEKERVSHEQSVSPSGNVRARYLQVAQLIYGALSAALTWTRKIPLRLILLALLLMSVILLRLDPASPASQGPILRLLLLFRQTFSSLFKNH